MPIKIKIAQKESLSKKKKAVFNFRIYNNQIVGRLHFRKSFSNVFVTLTDQYNKVVATMSGGRCTTSNSKRLKKAAHMMHPLMKKFRKTFDYYDIKLFEIILKSRGGWFVRTMIDYLRGAYSIWRVLDRRVRAHNGVRARKARRV